MAQRVTLARARAEEGCRGCSGRVVGLDDGMEVR